MGKRRTLRVDEDSHARAEAVQSKHGISPTNLLRTAVASQPSLEELAQYFPSAMSPITVDLTAEQWRQVSDMTEKAKEQGYCVTSQADLLRAYLAYQLKQLNGGAPPGG